MLVNLLRRLKPIRGIPLWVRYTATAIIVLACFALRFFLGELDEYGHLPLFLMFVPAVILASFLFDRGSGFVAVGLSAFLGLYFYVEPAGSFTLDHSGEIVRLAVFIGVGLLTASIIEALRTTVDDLSAQTEELSATRDRLAKSDQHRALLLEDINHRVKNHLATIAAGLALSRKEVADEAAREALDAAISRLNILGRAYTRLHASDLNVELEAKEFMEGLCADLSASLLALRPIAISCGIEPVRLDSQAAVALGLILNELVANAIKHAFPDDRAGEINVTFRQTSDGHELVVQDNGVGANAIEQGGTGTRLVRALVAQVKGSVDWAIDSGTKVIVQLPSKLSRQGAAGPV